MRRLLIVVACLAFFAPEGLFAATAGDLVKVSGQSAVNYLAADGQRYVFPNSATYFSWYEGFASVKTISSAELAAMPIGGNVTYRPGTRLLKIQTDPKVYAVAKGGVLRHVSSEAVAKCLLGDNWNVQIDDVQDAFFADYRVGEPIVSCAGYDAGSARVSVPTIGVDKGLDAPIAAAPAKPTFTVVPGPASVAAGQSGTLLELRLRTASFARIRRLPVDIDALQGAPAQGQTDDFDMGGLVRGANAGLNLKDLRWIDASGNRVFGTLSPSLDSRLDQRQSFDFGGAWDVPAGSDVRLKLVADFDADTPSNELYRAGASVSRILVEDGSGNAAPFLPSVDLAAEAVSVGKSVFEVSIEPIPESATQVRGASDAALAAFIFRAPYDSDAIINSIVFQSYVDEREGLGGYRAGSDSDDGTETRASSLVSAVSLVDKTGRVVAGPVAMPFDGRPVFADTDIVLKAGSSDTFVLRGDLRSDIEIGEHDDSLSFDITDVARDVSAVGPSGSRLEAAGFAPNGGSDPVYALAIRKHGRLSMDWTGSGGSAVAGREVSLGTLAISAAYDGFRVSTLTFTSIGAELTKLTDLRLNYSDPTGVARSASAVFTGNDATFNGLSIEVARGGSATAALYGRLPPAADQAFSGERLRVALSSDRPMMFSSEAEGRTFRETDIGNGYFFKSSAPSDVVARLTELKIRISAETPTGLIARGQAVEVLRFSVSVAPEGPAHLKRLTFRIESSEVGLEGYGNDALERWADVDGDAADDNGVIELRRFSASGREVIGEDLGASISYGILRDRVLDTTPHGLTSAFGDEARVTVEFADYMEPILEAGTTTDFSLELKTDSIANVSGAALKVGLLAGQDFMWSDVSRGFHAPLDGNDVPFLPLAPPALTLP